MKNHGHISSATQLTAAARYPSSDGGCRAMSPATHYSLFIVHYSLPPRFAPCAITSRAFSPRKCADDERIRVAQSVHCSLFIVHYSLNVVDPMSGKYPSLSPYTYCANNPVKLVDPNGEELIVADNEESRNDILSIVNDYNRYRVTFDEEGYDGQVVISKTGSFVWGNVNRRKNVVFHELAENCLRTAKGMDYLGPKEVGVHATAKNMEYKAWGSIETGAENYFPIDKHFGSDSPMYNKVIEYMIYGKH